MFLQKCDESDQKLAGKLDLNKREAEGRHGGEKTKTF